MKKIIILINTLFFATSAYAGMSDSEKNRAWECSGIYLSLIHI